MPVQGSNTRSASSNQIHPIQRLLPAMTLAAVFILLSGCGRNSTTGGQTPSTSTSTSSVLDATPGDDQAEQADEPDEANARLDAELTQHATQATGGQLYLQHCAACHGEKGDGQGVAAAYLFPKPRDFRTGRFRLVSTNNNVPTADDLEAVLLRGMPGSSMPPWPHLSKNDRRLLADEVMRFRSEGIQEQYTKYLKEEEELTDDELAQEDVKEEIEEAVRSRTTPGETTEVPLFGTPDEAAIARGRETYLKLGCHACHGKEGKGDGVQQQFDDEGYPTRPRDYTKGIFKGGHDPASLYRRVAYGMPGTPMPSTPSNLVTSEQIVDLVHFLRSLSDDEARQATILKRERLVTRHVANLPDSSESTAWSTVESMELRMVPLWWRDDADPHLKVQAVHDGTTMAVRLVWQDHTEDRHATQSESFEDAVAMELYRGDAEPFIGMGDPKSPIDVWFWDADRQGEPVAVEDLYPNTVVDVFPFSENAVAAAELDRDGARTTDQPEISLPARASGNLIMPSSSPSGASSLTAGGLGSVTFRIPRNQLVTAHGSWKDGSWTVVMTRPLTVDSNDDGVSLQPGERVSVAFAVWNGSNRDRDGKKLITIWQDLELEP